ITMIVFGEKQKATKVEIDLPRDFSPPGPLPAPIKELIEYKKATGKKSAKLVLKKGLSEEIVGKITQELGADSDVAKAVREKMQAPLGNESDEEPDQDER